MNDDTKQMTVCCGTAIAIIISVAALISSCVRDQNVQDRMKVQAVCGGDLNDASRALLCRKALGGL